MGRYGEAMQSYAKAMNSDKKTLAIYNTFIAAMKLKNSGKADEMRGLLKQADPLSAYTRRASAEMALVRGDTAQARDILEKIADKDRGDWLSLALLYADRADARNVQRCLEMVDDEEEGKKEKIQVMARLAFALKEYDRALLLWKEIQDTSFAFRYNYACAAYGAGRHDEVLKVLAPLAREVAGKDRGDVCRLAGNAAFALRKWEQALGWYRQLSNIEARDPVVQYNLAVACYNLGRTGESWEYYQRARDLDPSLHNKDIENRHAAEADEGTPANGNALADPLDSMYNEAVALQEQGQSAEARQLYQRIIARDSSHHRSWNNLGALYAAEGELEQAEKAYLAALRRRHDLPEAYANLVTLYIAMEKPAEARRWLLKGKGHNPDSGLWEELERQIDSTTDKK
jgi:tetratricopeptide (TPR) repeat protein